MVSRRTTTGTRAPPRGGEEGRTGPVAQVEDGHDRPQGQRHRHDEAQVAAL